MNDIKDILEKHAASIVDSGHADRLDGVHHRIAAVRRRRAGTAVGLTAVVLAVLVGVVVNPLHRQPVQPANAPKVLAGRTVPQSTYSLGYRYDYAYGLQGENGKVALTLPASTAPRLIRWASQDSAGTLIRSGNFETAWRTPAGSFGIFDQIAPSDIATKVTVRESGVQHPGRVAIAVYSLASAAPGITKGGVTFRQHLGVQTLYGGAIGDLGQADLTTTVRVPSFGYVATYCSAPGGFLVHTTVNGKPGITNRCGGPSFDPGTQQTLAADAEHGLMKVRVWVTDRKGNSRPIPADLRVGAAVYNEGPGIAPLVFESDGHTWQKAETFASAAGSSDIKATIDNSGPALIAVQSSGSRTMTLKLGNRLDTVGSRTVQNMDSVGEGGFWVTSLSGESNLPVSYSVSGPTPRRPIRLEVYRLVD